MHTGGIISAGQLVVVPCVYCSVLRVVGHEAALQTRNVRSKTVSYCVRSVVRSRISSYFV